MKASYAVVDLFAGPGGLAEGFSRVRQEDHSPYSIVLSVEKDEHAHKTLLLRSFLRQFERSFPAEYYQFLNGDLHKEPDWKKLYPDEWAAACSEALHLELGNEKQAVELDARLDQIREIYGDRIILIGGPPCQAYSLVGRARNKGVEDYVAGDDKRHFLYQEYIRILKRLRPAAFVMENVKGLLSSSIDGEKIFEKVLDDLAHLGTDRHSYRLIPLAARTNSRRKDGEKHKTEAKEYVVRAEDFGIPQARHRVILVGIRKDCLGDDSERINEALPKRTVKTVGVRAVLLGMPRLRSGLSEIKDTKEAWKKAVREAVASVSTLDQKLAGKELDRFKKKVRLYAKKVKGSRLPRSRNKSIPVGIGRTCPRKLKTWITDPRLKRLPNSETRGHMKSDLKRYFFVSVFGEATGVSPKAINFPDALAPKHENWSSGNFSDRFRVQLWDHPSTTITSHISKDGHYFIHPDPLQCRSLTVREAARLQTFPDNYLFKGNRTQQYVQVGNAVPPFLAHIIGESVLRLLGHTIENKRKKGPDRRRKQG